MWIPLLLGAVVVSWVSQRRPTTVYYRDAHKKLHPLDAVEGDGETFESGQILPGVSVKRLRVPRAWAGASLRELGVRERFGLTVIGMVDRRDTEHGLDERVVLNPRPDQLLTRGDLLIVLGEDDRLERFQEATRDSLPAPPTDGETPSGPSKRSALVDQVRAIVDKCTAAVKLASDAQRDLGDRRSMAGNCIARRMNASPGRRSTIMSVRVWL